MASYTVLCWLGEGTFGQVFKAKNKITGQVVALKQISKDKSHSGQNLRCLQKEIAMLKDIQHPCIVKFLGCFQTQTKFIIVMEYAGTLNLLSALSQRGVFPEDQVRGFTCQLVSAFYYLHKRHIVHRDVKTANIVLEDNGVVKLCDFGFAKVMTSSTTLLTSPQGTPLFLSPERVKMQPYDHTADLWALGCVLYQLCTGKLPFCGVTRSETNELILNSSVKFPDAMSSNCMSFIRGLLTKNPKERMAWPVILYHPFVAGNIPFITPASQGLHQSQTSKSSSQSSHTENNDKGQTPKEEVSKRIAQVTPQVKTVEDKELRNKLMEQEGYIRYLEQINRILTENNRKLKEGREREIEKLALVRKFYDDKTAELLVEIQTERERNAVLQQLLQDQVASSHQQAEAILQHQAKEGSLLNRVREDKVLIGKLKTKMEALCHKVSAEIAKLQNDASIKEQSLLNNMEELKEIHRAKEKKLSAKLATKRQENSVLEDKLEQMTKSRQELSQKYENACQRAEVLQLSLDAAKRRRKVKMRKKKKREVTKQEDPLEVCINSSTAGQVQSISPDPKIQDNAAVPQTKLKERSLWKRICNFLNIRKV